MTSNLYSPSSIPCSSSIHSLLIEVLNDHQGVATLLSSPLIPLSSPESQALRNVFRHYTKKSSNASASQKSNNSASSWQPWKRILNLDYLELPRSIEEHLEEHGTDAAVFLTDAEILHHKMIDFHDDENQADVFLASWRYTEALIAQGNKNTSRWCFMMLMYYDLVRIINPSGTDKGRVGYLMLPDILTRLGAPIEDGRLDLSEVLLRINEWSLYGSKLNALCSEFGPGCFFYLNNHLSEDFLKSKFGRTGKYQQEAFEHLENLGLKDKADKSQATELGSNIRHFLIQAFEVED